MKSPRIAPRAEAPNLVTVSWPNMAKADTGGELSSIARNPLNLCG
jgi:hypothetical protein